MCCQETDKDSPSSHLSLPPLACIFFMLFFILSILSPSPPPSLSVSVTFSAPLGPLIPFQLPLPDSSSPGLVSSPPLLPPVIFHLFCPSSRPLLPLPRSSSADLCRTFVSLPLPTNVDAGRPLRPGPAVLVQFN